MNRCSTSTGSDRRSAPVVRARFGDVALVAHGDVSFHDPADSGPFELVCRHGSLTSAEMLRAVVGHPELSPVEHHHVRPSRIIGRTASRRDHDTRRGTARPGGRRGGGWRSGRSRQGDGHRTGQGDAHRVDGQATARRGATRRRSTRPAANGWPRSTNVRSPNSPRRCRPTCRTSCTSLALPFDGDGPPTDGELRIAKAQLVGWLEGLFHGIQATLFAQQIAARQQLEQMRELPPGTRRGAHDGSRSRAPRHLPVIRARFVRGRGRNEPVRSGSGPERVESRTAGERARHFGYIRTTTL